MICIDSLKGVTLNKTSTSPVKLSGITIEFLPCRWRKKCETAENIDKFFESFVVMVYVIERKIDFTKFG